MVCEPGRIFRMPTHLLVGQSPYGQVSLKNGVFAETTLPDGMREQNRYGLSHHWKRCGPKATAHEAPSLPAGKAPIPGTLVERAPTEAATPWLPSSPGLPEPLAATQARPPAHPGPRAGTGRHAAKDRALFDEIDRLIKEENEGVYSASRRLLPRISGNGEAQDESRIRRLAKRYTRERMDKKDGHSIRSSIK